MTRIPWSCTRVLARLDLHLDGELEALAAARDAGHLEACASCARESAQRRRLREALADLPWSASADYEAARAGALAQLGASHHGRRRARRWLARAATAAAAVLGLLALGTYAPELAPALGVPRAPLGAVRWEWNANWKPTPELELFAPSSAESRP